MGLEGWNFLRCVTFNVNTVTVSEHSYLIVLLINSLGTIAVEMVWQQVTILLYL